VFCLSIVEDFIPFAEKEDTRNTKKEKSENKE